MDKTGIKQTSRREFLQVGATSAALALAGSSASASVGASSSSGGSQGSRKMAIFEAHSHMLMGPSEPSRQKHAVKDLTEVNLPELIRRWDEVGIEKVKAG